MKTYNSEPWKISLWDRLKKLDQETSKKTAVYIYEKADTSTFRYRAYNMCQSLEGSLRYRGLYFFEDELIELSEYLTKIDILIIVRVRWTVGVNAFIEKVKNNKIPTLFDIDDLVFYIEKLPIVMNTLNVDFNDPNSYNFWFAYASRLWIMGQICDATIGTNEYICNILEKYYKKPSYIINNFLNSEQIETSEKLYKQKKQKKNKDFKIGYFSGTPSHINDFKTVVSELTFLLEKYKDIKIEIVGFMEFPEDFKKFVYSGQVTHSPLVDFITLQKKISEVDLNIIPLLDNEFTNCKSELKFFEAAIVGTVTCATPTFVYSDNIIEGKTGFLCKEGEWASKIEKIYLNDYDENIIAKAREYCLEKYSPDKQLLDIENMLNKALK
jgi:glycosyltransferase involved in cell wall biosynthesis